MMKKFYTPPLLTSLLLSLCPLGATEFQYDTQPQKDWIILPYAFATENIGTAGGVGFIKQGLLQSQTTLVASIAGGLDKEVMIQGEQKEVNFSGAFFSFSNYQLPFTNRLFFSALGAKSYFPQAQYYFDGSNDSNKKDALTSAGDANFFYTTLSYMLPIGEGESNPQQLYTLKDGFAQHREGKGGGVPFLTGFTSVGIKSFYQYHSFENASNTQLQEWQSSGWRYFLEHDNTDFKLNPSRGYQFNLQYSHDDGRGENTQSWDFLAFKYNHYLPLENFSFTKQSILAMSLWTGYSDSWEIDEQIAPNINAHRPPLGEGGRLGGIFRMRGYNTNRFSDKAVFYATAEYRATLDYNPLRGNEYLPVAIDWFQVVGFVEAGRVHESYDFDLLSEMKYDVGVSLRAMVAQLPVRFDVAYSDEGVNMWLMINQPFDF
jgi:hypothetical protein